MEAPKVNKFFSITFAIIALFCSHSLLAKNISIGSTHTFNSKVLNEYRTYNVYLPLSYERDTKRQFPVIYLLDGGKMSFHAFTGLIEGFSSNLAANQLPEFIVVGIENVDRVRDFTPAKRDLTYKDQILAKLENPGHADKFAEFVKTELQPQINKKYRTDGRNVISGFSFGGLFALHALFNHPDIFDDYLVVDAPFIWDNNNLNKLLKKHKAELTTRKGNLFMAIADNGYLGEHGKMNTQWARDFANEMQKSNFENLNFSYIYLEQETHLTVFMHAWYQGLQALFRE